MASQCLEIINALVPGHQGLHRIQIDGNGLIDSIQSMGVTLASEISQQQVDIGGDWLSLGGVDLQINGALGLAFPDLVPGDEEKLQKICQFLWAQGVDGFLPTIVTTAVEKIHRALAVINRFREDQSSREPACARILGVHLEGPFLNPAKRGAHPEEYLLPLTLETIKRVLGDHAGIVSVITLAPELDPGGKVIPYLQSLGITASLGHSLATASEAQQALDLGATMVTHAFNAMPGLHHREPGLLGAAIAHPEVRCGLIADGQHVCPTMVDLLLRASRYDRGIFLVSDALAPLGLADGIYPWDSRQIEVRQGTARLLNGTLAGTTLPLLAGVKNLVKWGICDVGTAIALATTAPRQAIGLIDAQLSGSNLYIGQPAPFLRWHQDSETGELTWQRLWKNYNAC